MAVIIFGPQVLLGRVVRVVDRGSGQTPRLQVEQQEAPDAMGGRGWVGLSTIDQATFDALMLAAGVIGP
jgi:repressor of nif and glnA expression